jgi:hypothetical protein
VGWGNGEGRGSINAAILETLAGGLAPFYGRATGPRRAPACREDRGTSSVCLVCTETLFVWVSCCGASCLDLYHLFAASLIGLQLQEIRLCSLMICSPTQTKAELIPLVGGGRATARRRGGRLAIAARHRAARGQPHLSRRFAKSCSPWRWAGALGSGSAYWRRPCTSRPAAGSALGLGRLAVVLCAALVHRCGKSRVDRLSAFFSGPLSLSLRCAASCTVIISQSHPRAAGSVSPPD